MSSLEDDSFSWGTILAFVVVGYFIFGDGGCNSSISKSKECTSCYGTGEKECYSCYGSGDKNCSWCYGQGKQNCTTCLGSGKHYRYDYGYDNNNGGKYHYYYAYFPCKKCQQTGKIECTIMSCDNGKVECSSCYGKGTTKCNFCSGKGVR